MTNTNLLKGKIKEHGLSQKEVACALNLSQQALNQKINNKREFTVREIFAISKLLEIKDKDAYFFYNDVAILETKASSLRT